MSKGKRVRTWCSEESIPWFFLSLLVRRGFYPVMGLGKERFVVLSKSDLEPIHSVLGHNFVQGRHRLDIVAYDAERFVVGLVVSRIIPLCKRISDNVVELVLRMILAPPKDAVDAYMKLKRMGFDFASMNVAKAFKVSIASRFCRRLKSYAEGRKTVVMVILLDVGINEEVVIEILNALKEYLYKTADLNLKISIALFKPCEITPSPPAYVYIRSVAEELLDSGNYPYTEIMGENWVGCSKCKYVEVCSKYFGG